MELNVEELELRRLTPPEAEALAKATEAEALAKAHHLEESVEAQTRMLLQREREPEKYHAFDLVRQLCGRRQADFQDSG